MSSPYAMGAPTLLDLGYCAVPIMPGTKAPGEFYSGGWRKMRNWTERYRVNRPSPSQVNSWCELPDAGLCVLTGSVSQFLVGVDIDDETVVDAMRSSLPHTPCIKAGMKGETHLFRAKIPNSTFDRPLPDGRFERMVDILSDGRQTILPFTIHPETGKSYKWIGEQPLWEIPPDQLPWLPDDAFEMIEEILTPYGYSRERKPHSHLILANKVRHEAYAPTDYDSMKPYQQLNAWAWQHTDKWVEALHLYNVVRTATGWECVADWRSSSKGRVLAERDRNLHIHVGKNSIVDFGDSNKGYSPIDLVAAADNKTREQAFEWLAYKTGWVTNNYTFDLLTSEETPPVIEPPKPVVADHPPHWQVPGLVGAITQYMIDTAMYQQPMFALSAALCLVGAAAGRQALGPTKSTTLLYSMCVGPTACGKEHQLNAMQHLIAAAGLNDTLAGPGSFTSYSSVVKRLIDTPACIAMIDEIGAFLAKGKGKNAASYERQIFSLLRSMWSKKNNWLPTEERAQEKSVPIYWPAMTLYGTSTVEELFESLSSTDMTNGLMNRFLVFQNRAYPPPSDPVYEMNAAPPEIVEGLRAVATKLGPELEEHHRNGHQECKIPPYVVTWADKDVEAYYKQRREAVRMQMQKDGRLQIFLSRANEYAVRLATIRAIGINLNEPKVTMEDFKWADALVMECFLSLAEQANDHMSQGGRDADNKKVRKAARNLEDRGADWFSIRDIQQQSCVRPLNSEEIRKVLGYYEELGELVKEDRTDPKKDAGRKTYYRFLK